MGLIVGGVVFVLETLLAIFVIYPAVFNFFHGLFSNSDVGTLIGLVACVMISGLLLTVALGVAAIAGILVSEKSR